VLRYACLVLFLVCFLVGPLPAADLVFVASHRVKLNLDGRVLGVHEPTVKVHIPNVAPGSHKLFARSLKTGELRTFRFDATARETEVLSLRADFSPLQRGAQTQGSARRLVLDELIGGAEDTSFKESGGRQGDEVVFSPVSEKARAKGMSRIVIEVDVPVDINLDGAGAVVYAGDQPICFEDVKAGHHKVYLRFRRTRELRMVTFVIEPGNPQVITVRPRFVTVRSSVVLSKTGRGSLAGMVRSELVSSDFDARDKHAEDAKPVSALPMENKRGCVQFE